MFGKSLLALAALGLAGAATAFAQATGVPSYRSPAPGFVRSELGGVVSFPEPGGTAFEAVYRRATWGTGIRVEGDLEDVESTDAQWRDFGIRAGVYDAGSGVPSALMLGLEGRMGLFRHTEDVPFDLALTLGVGGRFRDDANVFLIPAGLTAGRAIRFENSDLVLTPFVHPIAFLRTGNNIDTDVHLGVGLGGDLRLNPAVNLQLSVGLGDEMEGISLGASWTR
jgi:hypothetical protein